MNSPQLYSDYSSDSMQHSALFLDRYKDWIQWDDEDPETILDIGSGPGDVTVSVLKAVAPQTTTIIGCDLSQAMVDFSNSKYRDSKTWFELLDITSKQTVHDRWRKGSINKIFSFYAIHSLRLQRDAVANMSYLLKQGGQILLLFPIEIPIFHIYNELLQDPEWSEYHEIIRGIIPLFVKWDNPCEVYTKIMCEENFTDIGCNLIFCSFQFPSAEAYLNLFESVTPLKSKLPEHMLPKLLQDAESIIRQKKLLSPTKEDGSGPVICSYKLMEVTATRKR